MISQQHPPDDHAKTKDELIAEIQALRGHVAALEDAGRQAIHEADETPRREHDLLERITKTSPVGITVIDRHGQISFANAHAEKILGLTVSEITRRTYNTPEWKITDYEGNPFPEDQLPFIQVKTRLEAVYDVCHAIEWPNGERVYLSINASPLLDDAGQFAGMVAVIDNITQQKEAEDALRESRQMLRLIMDHIPYAIFWKDRDLIYQGCNRQCAESAGLKNPEEIIGKTDYEMPWAYMAETYRANDREVLATGKAKLNYDAPQITPDGQEIWLRTSKIPLYDAGGEVVAVLGLYKDITEQRETEKQALELAIHKEQMRVLSQFIQDASHEFKTPLSMINLSTYVLRRTKDPQIREGRLEQIVGYVKNITQLVDDLVRMAELDSDTPLETTPVDLHQMIQDVRITLQEDIRQKDILVNLDFLSQTPLVVPVNLDGWFVAIKKLLHNAIRYTPDGGTVTISTRKQDNALLLSIKDTGIGMDKEALAQIFDRFYRADKAHTTGGFGLGLPIAQQIIKRHGGRIEVDSTPGEGSTFTVILPDAP